MSKRSSKITRNTNETQIELSFTLDGDGNSNISTGIGFFDHMLTLFTKHGLFDLTLKVNGDLQVDFHHTVEDVGICLGQAFREALGDCAGIHRYASGAIPMDEALCDLAVDISGRPHLTFIHDIPPTKVGELDMELTEEFFHALINNARITAHMQLVRGRNLHHCAEACFKAMGQILDRATQIDPRKTGVPSTKGVL